MSKHTCEVSGITFPTKDKLATWCYVCKKCHEVICDCTHPELEWVMVAREYPPYDKPVLITDGKLQQICTFRINEGIKYWEVISNNSININPTHWRYLPELPDVK